MRKTFIIAGLLICSIHVFAQRDTVQGGTIDVVKTFKPVLSEAIKIPVNPNPEVPEITKPEFRYTYTDQRYASQPTIYPIKPLSLGTQLLPKLRNNYIKAGFGNYTSPLLEVYLTSVRNKQWNAGIEARHHSGQGDQEFNNFSDNSAHGWAKYFMPKGAVSGDLAYARNVVMLYGFQPGNLKPAEDDLRIAYNNIDFKAGYENMVTDSEHLAFRAGLNYYNYSANSGVNENNFMLDGHFRQQALGIPFELYTAYTYNQTQPLNFTRNYFDFNPRASLVDPYFYIKAGFNAVMYSDNKNTSELNFFPVAEGGYHIIKDRLTLYAGITGGLKRNTFRSVTRENPFVVNFNSKTPFPNTLNNFEMYGGLKGELGRKTAFMLQGGIANMKNLLFFAQDSNLFGQVTLYDESANSATVTTLTAGLNHQLSDKIRFGLTLNSYSYSLSVLSKPYSRPTLDAKVNFSYNMGDKFLFKADVFYMDERTGAIRSINTNGIQLTEVNLGHLIDLNLGLDYRYNRNVSAFISLNNLANNRYQRWTNYPVYGFNVMGGLTFTF